jgi:hypothetical protein
MARRRNNIQIAIASPRMQNQAHYQRRKQRTAALQRCVRCPTRVEDGYACCQACRAKMAAGRHAARAAGYCVDCWTVPTLPGKRYCADHEATRQRERSRRYTQRLVQHLCVRCGTQKSWKALTTCESCTRKKQLFIQKKRVAVAEESRHSHGVAVAEESRHSHGAAVAEESRHSHGVAVAEESRHSHGAAVAEESRHSRRGDEDACPVQCRQ